MHMYTHTHIYINITIKISAQGRKLVGRKSHPYLWIKDNQEYFSVLFYMEVFFSCIVMFICHLKLVFHKIMCAKNFSFHSIIFIDNASLRV